MTSCNESEIKIFMVICFLAAISSNMAINSTSAKSGGNKDFIDDYRSSLDLANTIPNVSQNLSNHSKLHQRQHFCINATIKVFDCSLITCTSDEAKLASIWLLCNIQREHKITLSSHLPLLSATSQIKASVR